MKRLVRAQSDTDKEPHIVFCESDQVCHRCRNGIREAAVPTNGGYSLVSGGTTLVPPI